MDNPTVGGWRVLFSSESAGTHILTVEMTSVASGQQDYRSVSVDVFTFDHEPSQAEIQAAVTSHGFTPVIEAAPVSAGSPIKIVTEGEPDVLEYGLERNPDEYRALYNQIPIPIAEMPTSMSLKGEWLYLYYAGRQGNPPTQFFDQPHFLYSVRIKRDTGEVRRKAYDLGLTLDANALAGLQGADQIQNIILTGAYLDEPMVTLYYMKSSAPEDYVSSPGTVRVPYLGTTWENGIKSRTREYMPSEPLGAV
jgi:hypothetical protein